MSGIRLKNALKTMTLTWTRDGAHYEVCNKVYAGKVE